MVLLWACPWPHGSQGGPVSPDKSSLFGLLGSKKGDGRNTLLTAQGDLAEVFQPVLPQEYNRNNEPLSSGCCTTRASVQAVLLCLYLPPCQAVHVVHQEVTSAQAA